MWVSSRLQSPGTRVENGAVGTEALPRFLYHHSRPSHLALQPQRSPTSAINLLRNCNHINTVRCTLFLYPHIFNQGNGFLLTNIFIFSARFLNGRCIGFLVTKKPVDRFLSTKEPVTWLFRYFKATIHIKGNLSNYFIMKYMYKVWMVMLMAHTPNTKHMSHSHPQAAVEYIYIGSCTQLLHTAMDRGDILPLASPKVELLID